VIAFQTRLGTYAFGRGGGGEIGAAARFAQGEGSERGALPRRERCKDAPACSGVPPSSTGSRPSMVPSKVSEILNIDGVELFGQYRHVHNTCALTAERYWNQAAGSPLRRSVRRTGLVAAKRASGVGRSCVAGPTFVNTSRAKARASARRRCCSGVSMKSIGMALLQFDRPPSLGGPSSL
jgi:hypothetical protein